MPSLPIEPPLPPEFLTDEEKGYSVHPEHRNCYTVGRWTGDRLRGYEWEAVADFTTRKEAEDEAARLNEEREQAEGLQELND